MMSENALRTYVVRLGDDALVLGHRLSEWCRNGPFLEEDLALANVALDFLGRARMFYGYAAELDGPDVSEDTYAYSRDCREFTNLLMFELPKGDFAFTMARQYLVDEFGLAYMNALTASRDERLAAIADKAVKESQYHLRRSTEWMLRLGDGTDESHRRLQTAVDDLWGYATEFFEMDAVELSMLETGVGVDAAALRAEWRIRVGDTLARATIRLPEDTWSVTGGRAGIHTEHLGHLLSELQFLQRAYPGSRW